MANTLYELDGLLWELGGSYQNTYVLAYCPKDRFELDTPYINPSTGATFGICPECDTQYNFKRSSTKVVNYLEKWLKAKEYQDAEILSIDGVQTPVVKTRQSITTDNGEYWIEARLNDSAKGRVAVIYIGQKGSSQKAQLFVHIDQGKLSFDHKDLDPMDIVSIVSATFPSGSSMNIER